MRFMKRLFITTIILGAVGFTGYYLVNKYLEDQAVEYVENDFVQNNDLAVAREYVNSSPALKEYIQEGANADLTELPIQTREEATRLVMKKLSLQEMQQIQSKAANGMTEGEVLELIQTFEHKLTDEELLALKAIIYQELYG
ncbi:hypothetical protein [Sutcliffiella rhizosphaerae]|uniref:Phenylalanyl-tRNA synthetase subunit beta n=1 Tax=Sutcliffiella rhizosphaerae TaxID=2880967 RepID=A0ABM8YTG2_9BACI|nr:hypothetical protein [Sutcliffiella rhizosphaerae]CAG9623246.1 hypothetical protein BACCIP111883_04042 [Sutcliffiella rhizosphaerae]